MPFFLEAFFLLETVFSMSTIHWGNFLVFGALGLITTLLSRRFLGLAVLVLARFHFNKWRIMTPPTNPAPPRFRMALILLSSLIFFLLVMTLTYLC